MNFDKELAIHKLKKSGIKVKANVLILPREEKVGLRKWRLIDFLANHQKFIWVFEKIQKRARKKPPTKRFTDYVSPPLHTPRVVKIHRDNVEHIHADANPPYILTKTKLQIPLNQELDNLKLTSKYLIVRR